MIIEKMSIECMLKSFYTKNPAFFNFPKRGGHVPLATGSDVSDKKR
jgi:hypothetical protein